MPGINVWVSPLDQEVADDGLDRDHIRLEVEKRLIGAGLPVVQQIRGEQAPKFPCLGVVLYVFRPQGDPPVYIFSIEMFFVQRITLAGSPATESMHLAWCRETTGEVFKNAQGFKWSTLYQASEFLVDRFIMEYLPSQASVDQLSETQTPEHTIEVLQYYKGSSKK